jgi:hypothetical protein
MTDLLQNNSYEFKTHISTLFPISLFTSFYRENYCPREELDSLQGQQPEWYS